jgi:hypothetical protein
MHYTQLQLLKQFECDLSPDILALIGITMRVELNTRNTGNHTCAS